MHGDEAAAAENIFGMSGKEATFKDSVTGQPLEPTLVKAVRKLEVEYFDAKEVWEKRPRAEALARTGKAPISVRWIDTNKGDDDAPNYRSRLVAREIRRRGKIPIFAPAPPLESFRAVVSLAATAVAGPPKHERNPRSQHRTQLSVIDISRAYFCAATGPEDPTYVESQIEDPEHGVVVVRLLKHMCGTRKARDGWHEEISGTLTSKLGFPKEVPSACIFRHPEGR